MWQLVKVSEVCMWLGFVLLGFGLWLGLQEYAAPAEGHGGLPPRRFRRLEFDARYVPPKLFLTPYLLDSGAGAGHTIPVYQIRVTYVGYATFQKITNSYRKSTFESSDDTRSLDSRRQWTTGTDSLPV